MANRDRDSNSGLYAPLFLVIGVFSLAGLYVHSGSGAVATTTAAALQGHARAVQAADGSASSISPASNAGARTTVRKQQGGQNPLLARGYANVPVPGLLPPLKAAPPMSFAEAAKELALAPNEAIAKAERAGKPTVFKIRVPQGRRYVDRTTKDVLEHCKRFSANALRLGTLIRRYNNRLQFPVEPTEPFYIFYRMHPRRRKGQGEIPLAAMASLRAALAFLSPAQRKRTALYVLYNKQKYGAQQAMAWKSWFESQFGANGPVQLGALHLDPNVPASNYGSYNAMVKYMWRVRNPRAVAFCLEDDYWLAPSLLQEMVEFYASHDPCVVVPFDYPDRYTREDNKDDTQVTVVAASRRTWRSVESMPVTFSGRLELLEALRSKLPNPNNDRHKSYEMRAAGVKIMGPTVTLAVHTNSMSKGNDGELGRWSLYVDIEAWGRSLMKLAHLWKIPGT